MDITQRAISAVVGADPQKAALVTLELVRGHLSGRAAALFSIRPELRLFTATAMDQQGIDRVVTAWASQSVPLLRGESLLEPGHLIAPIGAPAEALLYVSSPRPQRDLVTRVLAALSPLLQMAISSPEAAAESYIEKTPIAEIERDQLLLLLERARGNITQLAKRLGVTRMTVYQRLKRHGIEHRGARRIQ